MYLVDTDVFRNCDGAGENAMIPMWETEELAQILEVARGKRKTPKRCIARPPPQADALL
jgi:hypothetical protein